MSVKLDYHKEWSNYFKLDENSPSGLVRIKSKHGNSIEAINVGTKQYRKNGTAKGWSLEFRDNMYYIHRIIWVMTYGSIDPELVVDHIDGDPLNNIIENLSLKTITGNSRNRRKHGSNRTGVTGVKLTDKGNGRFYYEAHWNTIEGLPMRKCFSVAKLGETLAKCLAVEHREKQMQKLILDGAGYTERHGK